MRIARVEAIQLTNIPTTPPPFRKAPADARLGILEIETDDGCVGYGITRSGAGGFIEHQAADVLRGKNPVLTDEIWQELVVRFGRRGDAGPHAADLAAIDVALWDLKGKALGLPVWRLLGGAQRRVEAYVSFGVAGPNTSNAHEAPYSVEELAQEARYLVERGHPKLKTAVGRADVPDPDGDAARMAAVREAVGADGAILMDAACRMAFPDALRLCTLCEPLGVTFFEEPVSRNDPRLLAELRRRTAVPLAANPSGYRWAYRDLLLHDAADFLQPNVTQIGVTEAWTIAEMAKAFDRQIANGNGGGPHNLHLQAGLSNGWGVEFHYHNWMTYQAVFKRVPAPQDGWVTPPDAPGFDLDPKPEVLKEFRQRSD
jgi:L-alanine-DL-glutamate epimerase-like enolase superfamily enzyme